MSSRNVRLLKPALSGSALLLMSLVLTVACTKNSEFFTSDAESVNAGSSEITFENYRDRKIVITVPPGNHNPELSWATLNTQKMMPRKTFETFGKYTTDELRAELERRFQAALQSIGSDRQTMNEIRKAAQLYGIDPVLIVGNIVGEHVYNVPIVMKAQDYVMTKATWAGKWALRFTSNGVSLAELLKEPAFAKCDSKKAEAHSEYWDCVSNTWETAYKGKTIGDRSYSGKNFKYTFFDPISSGYTYGIGQLDPVRALMVADRVNRTSGLRFLSIDDPVAIYEDIIDPRSSVHYVAANIVLSLEIYRKYAGFDISKNPGLLATLYNLGKEKQHAGERYNATLKTLKAGGGVEIPVESYYGFFINEKERELRAFISSPGGANTL